MQHKPRKPIPKEGKVAKDWKAYRADWLKRHPQDWFFCYLCGQTVHRGNVTLDHVIPRSGAPELRYADSNIKPAHYLCNSQKGSKRL